MEKSFDRRRFIQGAAGMAGANILGSCGGENLVQMSEPTQVSMPSLQEIQTINQGATVNDMAVRGEQTQVGTTLPPPKTWQDGAFITKVLLPDGNLSFGYTVDDGPSPYNTDLILRECERLGIFVTFFLVGVNIRAWPEIARRIRDAGHEIGSHSVYHTPYSAIPLAGQMPQNKEIIHETTGLWVVANRTPGLTRGGDNIILRTARDLGMYELHTRLAQSDYKSPRQSAQATADELANQIGPGEFSLNHDGGGLRPTGTGWATIADVAISRGYKCVRATEMINMGTPYPGNVSYSAQISNPENYNEENIEFSDFCSYDPKAELETRLKDVHLKGPERSRIVEVLADIEKQKIESQQ